MTPLITDPKVRILAGKVTIRGLVSGHDEFAEGAFFETPPIVVLDTEAKTAKTKTTTYTWEGDLK